MARFVALFALCAADSVDVKYELPTGVVDISAAFGQRVQRLEARVAESDNRIGAFSAHLDEVAAGMLPRASATSFVSSRLQPVDATLVHDGLALSEPMRPSTQSTVNVVMGEDVANMEQRAKYQGMRDNIVRMHADFESDLAALRGA